jgi:hypothetical protein
MLGNFQQSQVRIEVDANRQTIADSLLKTTHLRQWMWPQSLSSSLPDTLNTGLTFTSVLGLIEIEHQVETADDNCLRLLLSKGIDGYHEWYWGWLDTVTSRRNFVTTIKFRTDFQLIAIASTS